VHAKRLDKTPAASVRGDPGAGKTVLPDHLAADGSSLTNSP
jgi:KaiC/GvpD/RAD55 family RecA-like ATPase